MHRLLVDSASLELDAPVLSEAAAKHLRVVRPRDGEEIELFDGRGGWRVYAAVKDDGRWGLRSRSEVFRLRPPAFDLVLFACVTKGSRWDWTVEKATELGVTRIVPVISERTIVRIPAADRAAKRDRWRRIAEDAARQSDAKWLPEILAPVDFAEALELVKRTRCFVGALTDPPPRMFLDELAGSPVPFAGGAVFVGPEGDFTPEELRALTAAATPVSFGPTVLRAETAAIFGVSVLAAFAATR